jgi:glycosyltransferase involved in cell wall biosynthesis
MGKRVLFIDGTKGYSPHRLKERPCGGIITSLTIISRYLAAQGHDVTIASHYDKNEKVDGVRHVGAITDDLKDVDVVVYNRNLVCKAFNQFFGKAYKVWWLHDVTQLSYLPDDGFKGVDKIIALSRYCKRSYADFYDIPEYKFEIIQNGVDKNIFKWNGGDRNKDLFICASAPIKGLKPLAFAYNNMKRHNPKAEIRLYCSQALHDLEDSEYMKKTLAELSAMGIKVNEPVPQAELATLMREARGLLMPNNYPEICSNLMLQAQSSGCAVITSGIGSMPDFITHKQTGMLTKTAPHDGDWFFKEYTQNTIEIMQDDDLFKFISRAAAVEVPNWEKIGVQWSHVISEAR